jgi:putative ATP-dependent endonuclease of the OLD family
MRVRNFRGIGDCVLDFERDLTILVGRNNSGKSRLLRALAIALGAAVAEKDDLTVGGEPNAVIDIVLAPSRGPSGEDVFDDRVGQRLGRDVQSLVDQPAQERFAWRTTIELSQEGLGVRTDTALMIYNQMSQDWELHENPKTPTQRQRSIVATDLVQTRCDLVEELTKRGSPIRRVLDDLEVDPKIRTSIEARLKDLGGDIVASSKSLEALKTALTSLAKSVDEIGSPRARYADAGRI